MKKIFIVLFCILIITSCSNNEKINEEKFKEDVSNEVERSLQIRYKSDSMSWDKKVEIREFNKDNTAIKGKWYANDAYDWIAYKDNNNWKILISIDGFECNKLDKIPAQYNEFFKDTIYIFENKYCYDWENNN